MPSSSGLCWSRRLPTDHLLEKGPECSARRLRKWKLLTSASFSCCRAHAATNQHRALSVLGGRETPSQVLCVTGQKTKPGDSQHHPSQGRCSSTCAMESRAFSSEPGLMYTGKIVWMYHVFGSSFHWRAYGSKVHSPQTYTRGACVCAPVGIG